MAKKLTSVLGVDIGSQKIKIAEIKSQGREAVVTTLGIIDTPEGSVDHTGVYNSDAVGIALKQVILNSGATIGDVVVSIAGQASVLVRTLEVPRMNPAELKDHMQWEINRNIPFAESTVLSDFKQLGTDDGASPNLDVVMAISPQSAIDTIIACIKKAGRKISAIDVEPLGIARSLYQSYEEEVRGQTVCMVNVGHKTTSINIYKDGKLLMPRQVPVGGEMFTRAIADNLTISMAEAEVIKREQASIPEQAAAVPSTNPFTADATGFQAYNPFAEDGSPVAPPVASNVPTGGYAPFEDQPFVPPVDQVDGTEPVVEDAPVSASQVPVPQDNPEQMRIYNAFASVLDEFVVEVRRSVDYFRSRGGEINCVLLCGGGARLKGLPEFLTSSLGLPCDSYDPMRRLNLNMRKVPSTFVDEYRQEFAVAVGNGLHIFFD